MKEHYPDLFDRLGPASAPRMPSIAFATDDAIAAEHVDE